MKIFVLAYFLIYFPNAYGDGKCTREDEKVSGKLVSRDANKTWVAFYDTYLKLNKCDDWDVAEGISDLVGNLLSNKWSLLPEINKLAKRDKDLRNSL